MCIQIRVHVRHKEVDGGHWTINLFFSLKNKKNKNAKINPQKSIKKKKIQNQRSKATKNIPGLIVLEEETTKVKGVCRLALHFFLTHIDLGLSRSSST